MSLNYHEGVRFQRGRGIGSLLSGLFRWLRPIASMGFKAGKTVLANPMVQKLGNTALDIGKTAAQKMTVDLLEGKAFKDTAKESIADAKKVLASTLKGGGKRKRKRCQTTKICGKKQKYSLLE